MNLTDDQRSYLRQAFNEALTLWCQEDAIPYAVDAAMRVLSDAPAWSGSGCGGSVGPCILTMRVAEDDFDWGEVYGEEGSE